MNLEENTTNTEDEIQIESSLLLDIQSKRENEIKIVLKPHKLKDVFILFLFAFVIFSFGI
jgi:hypothetical protein